MAMVGDDVRLDVALGLLGRSTTVLVRSGISADLDLSSVPAERRPDLAVDTVADLLDRL
jgi:ribonucleotide monophosphatase NagD (HAD superfamily)